MGRGLPPMTLAILASLLAAYLGYLAAPPETKAWIGYAFALYPARFAAPGPESFAHWYEAAGPLIGHAFLHGGWGHLFMNGLVLIQGAPIVEWRIGPWRLLALFTISAIAGAAAYIFINPNSVIPAVGASGAACGVFAGYFLGVGRHWREAIHRPEIRNGAIIFLVVNVGLAAVARITGFLPIAWEAHLGGFIGGAIAYLALAPRRMRGPWG